ncbi:MAG TPA: 50S ribosomal protein L9 [Candidatus Limnocylindria bacterium]|jgi:large subunit ribosomal protein L9|nr:50S ribosomal protein L9 [Candidatus Limnocylindria bacterium]
MRVILKSEVRGLGRPGDVKDVADGYARNYLLPKGLAIEATGGELKHLAQERNAAKAKKDRAHEDAEELAKRLHDVTLVFKLKAGDQGKTFGSVTAKEVAEALGREVKADIDKTKIVLHEPLRSLGIHKVEVRILADVRADVTVAIEPA